MNTADSNLSGDQSSQFAGDQSQFGGENGPDSLEDMNTDENLAGTTHLNDTVSDDDELEKAKEELQAQKDKYLRLVAEFDNFRKRTARENLESRQTAGKE